MSAAHSGSPDPAYKQALYAAAMAYVGQGLTVIPLAPVTYSADGKKRIQPLIAWQRYPDTLVTRADQVEKWFGPISPTAGIAIATGPSGLLMVDDDSHKDGVTESTPPPGAWVERHAGRGGWHAYVRNPTGSRNTAGKVAIGLDTRGDGGLSICAPTRSWHADGSVTQWLTDRPLVELSAAALPDAHADLIRAAPPVRHLGVAGEAVEVEPAAAQASVARGRDDWLASAHGGRHTALIAYLAVLVRYRLAQGARVQDIIGELEAAADEHPDAIAGEVFHSVPDAISWAIGKARENPWVLAPATGFAARFDAEPPPLPAALGPDEDDPDALTWDDYDGEYVPPVPSMLDLGWTLPLLYQGTPEDPRTNLVFGAPGCGKTWLAIAAVVQRAAAGERVWYVDYENSKPSLVARLKAMGLSREDVSRVTYTRASQEPAQDLHRRMAAASSGRYGLVVIDGLNAALSSMNANENSTGEVTSWYQRFVSGIPSVLILDHVAKSNDGMTRRTAIGSQAKEAIVSGVMWFVEKLRSFGTGGGTGLLKLTLGKDRPGGLEGRVPRDELLVDVRVETGGGKVSLEVQTRMGEAVSPQDAVFGAMHLDGVPLGLTQREFLAEFSARNGGTGVSKGRVASTMKRYEEFVIEADRAGPVLTLSQVTDT